MPDAETPSLEGEFLDVVLRLPEIVTDWELLFHDLWGLMAGGLFVAFYAKARFENPPSNRSSTTWLRYYSTLLLYVASAITLFLFIEILLRASPSLLTAAARLVGADLQATAGAAADAGILDSTAAAAETQEPQRTTYLLAALCMTVFLPTIGPLRRMDERLKQLFQDLAVIPHQVLMLASKLDKADFEPDPALAKAGSDDAGRPISRDLSRKWQQLQSLGRFLGELAERPKYARFLSGFEDLKRDASGHHQSITPAVVDCLRIASRIDLKAVQGQEPMQQAVGKYVGSIEASIDRCARRYHRLIARAVLACETSSAARMAMLRQAGYRNVRFERPNLQSFFNYVSFAFVIVIASMLLVSVIGPYFAQSDTANGGDPLKIILLAIRIALVFAVATFWAVAGLGRTVDDPMADRPGLHLHWGQYCIAAVFATLSQIGVNFAMNVTIHRDFIVAFEHIPRSFPWAVMVFALTYVLAMLCEMPRPQGLRTRLSEAAALAATLGLSAVVTVLLIKGDPEWFIGGPHDPIMLVTIPGTSAVIGAILGFIIPESFRNDRRRRAEREATYRTLKEEV